MRALDDKPKETEQKVKYYDLKSLLKADKASIPIRNSSSSFCISDQPLRRYIEPTFEKTLFESEKPTIILVSAVGVTGKTTLAKQLSYDLDLPMLDLAKHKPVGADALTGLLTYAFDVKNIGQVLECLARGEYGIIIDGVDEARAKTTERAFEAFLDDITERCSKDSGTTFLMLGRTRIMEDFCWAYLSDKGISTALITISPFTTDKAKEYIDSFTSGMNGQFASQYCQARDTILDRLSKAFAVDVTKKSDDFLSFIGYPPVLDAIVTLLTEEANYHKLLQALEVSDRKNIEVQLLLRIAQYILDREREQKVIPNIIRPLIEQAPDAVRTRALDNAFSHEEQCIRIVAHCLDKPLQLCRLRELAFDEQYEEQLGSWLPEHPFLSDSGIRNAVFEALVLAEVIAAGNAEYQDLLNEYLATHKSSYHLVYMLDVVLEDNRIALENIGPLFTAAMEFRSVHSHVELRVEGPEFDFQSPHKLTSCEAEIEIEIYLGANKKLPYTFTFRSDITSDSQLHLGSHLAEAFISVPCSVMLGGTSVPEIELVAPVEITAQSVTFSGSTLILRSPRENSAQNAVVINSYQMNAQLREITTNNTPLAFVLMDKSGLAFPVIKYTQQASQPPSDPLLKQKYHRLKRILMEFRAHRRGALARYKYKIESERVLKNETGRAVLRKLVDARILSLEGDFYFLDPNILSDRVGITWLDLRMGRMPESLSQFLGTVD
jgi:hypothetical protein